MAYTHYSCRSGNFSLILLHLRGKSRERLVFIRFCSVFHAPVSMRAAIDLLATAKERKVAVLGDMFELGEKEEELHAEVGAYAQEKEIDVLICVGRLSKNMYEGALSSRKEKEAEVYYFESRDEMLSELPGLLKKGDTILVKASHGMHFEKVVEFLQKEGR